MYVDYRRVAQILYPLLLWDRPWREDLDRFVVRQRDDDSVSDDLPALSEHGKAARTVTIGKYVPSDVKDPFLEPDLNTGGTKSDSGVLTMKAAKRHSAPADVRCAAVFE
jgi:hypothetical protein